MLLCVWWDFEGIINHFELVQNGAVNPAPYSEQLHDRVYAALAACHHPALLSRKRQHDNTHTEHTTALIKAKIKQPLL